MGGESKSGSWQMCGNVARGGIKGMKEWQGEKVEEVGEQPRRDQCERVQRWEVGENKRWIDGCIL